LEVCSESWRANFRKEATKVNLDELIMQHLDIAIQAAKLAGSYVVEAEKAGSFSVHSKRENDFVTDIDIAAERIIIEQIQKHFPEDAIFGEESGKSENSEQGRWIIDPIDGTTNFFRSLPNYTISIAWELEAYAPLVGVVFNPVQNELFYASKNRGAYLNGEPIHVSNVSDISKALMVCVPPHRHHELADQYFSIARQIFHNTSDFRSFGSCALELSYIAAGRIDGYYELCLGYYDMAAGAVILEEAGGAVTHADPDRPFSDDRCDIVASNGLIQDWILHMVQS